MGMDINIAIIIVMGMVMQAIRIIILMEKKENIIFSEKANKLSPAKSQSCYEFEACRCSYSL
jgi:hypothetical protein